MKRFITAVAICGVLIAGGALLAADGDSCNEPRTHSWKVGDGNWRVGGNWVTAGYPGKISGTFDDAVIDKNTQSSGTTYTATLSGNLNEAPCRLTISDGTSSNPMQLSLGSGVTLTITEKLLVDDLGTVDSESYVEMLGAGALVAEVFEIAGGSNGATLEYTGSGSITTN